MAERRCPAGREQVLETFEGAEGGTGGGGGGAGAGEGGSVRDKHRKRRQRTDLKIAPKKIKDQNRQSLSFSSVSNLIGKRKRPHSSSSSEPMGSTVILCVLSRDA